MSSEFDTDKWQARMDTAPQSFPYSPTSTSSSTWCVIDSAPLTGNSTLANCQTTSTPFSSWFQRPEVTAASWLLWVYVVLSCITFFMLVGTGWLDWKLNTSHHAIDTIIHYRTRRRYLRFLRQHNLHSNATAPPVFSPALLYGTEVIHQMARQRLAGRHSLLASLRGYAATVNCPWNATTRLLREDLADWYEGEDERVHVTDARSRLPAELRARLNAAMGHSDPEF